MKTIYKIGFFLISGTLLSITAKSQTLQSRFAIETTFNDKTPIAYEENYASLKLNSNTSDLTFNTNLSNIRTGDKNVDSLLIEQENIQFTFQANLGQGLFGLINEENDDTYHKILGTITVNNINYKSEAYVKIENFADKSNMSKSLLDFKLQFDPKIIIIPYLSNYFNNTVLFQMNGGIINQNN